MGTTEGKPDAPERFHVAQEEEIAPCPTCGAPHHFFYTVAWEEDGETIALGQSWADEDAAQDVCDYMNDAYRLGRADLSSLKRETVERVRTHLECHTSGDHYADAWPCKCDTETLLRDVLAEVEKGER